MPAIEDQMFGMEGRITTMVVLTMPTELIRHVPLYVGGHTQWNVKWP